MVEVTRKNFDVLLPEIATKINQSTFLCIDAEYTGLYSEELRSANTLFDSASGRYLKVRENVSKFVACQYGLAIFRKDKDANIYHVETYSFYLFPVAFDAFAKRDLLVCQVSCINFLARHNFDFNKFMRDGIPYLNNEKAESLRNFLKANRHFMHTSEYLDKDYFPEPAKQHILVNEQIDDIIDRLAGFSKIIDVIHKSNKPVVGHNLWTDLLLTHQLLWADLPASYEAFKKSMHDLFPLVYDTKHLARVIHNLRRDIKGDDILLADTNLFALYTNTYSAFELNMPLVEPAGESEIYRQVLIDGRRQKLETLDNSCCHNAGFDALITGCVFLNLSYMAARPHPTPDFRRGLPPTFSELLGKTECWSNRINIARAIISHTNLGGRDPETTRPNWIVVKSIDGKFIDPVKLKLDMIKYGDMEIKVVHDLEVVVACGALGCSRRVWKDLGKKGYSLQERTFTADGAFETRWRFKMVLATVATCAIAAFVSIRYIKNRITQ